MAVLPSKNTANAKLGGAGGARFRQRKISVKQPLAIYKQKDLPTLDINNELEPSQIHHLSSNSAQQLRDLHAVDTGVDKNEEDEVHLQQVINAAQRALLGSERGSKKEPENKESVYIPTPDASRIWPEAPTYYNDHTFKEPESYIKFSATVEDTVGVEYCIDEIDFEFFETKLKKNYPKKKDETTCTELEFEIVCDKLEKTIDERQPFLSMDPSNILSYKELSSQILEEFKNVNPNKPYVQAGSTIKYIPTTDLKEKLSKELKLEPFVTLFDKNPNDQSSTVQSRPIPKLIELFGEPIYDHWKGRKIARRGKQIHPVLKFEDPNATEKDNDNDPYICFRRREFRQARKTRRADALGSERIRLLQKSLHRARDLVLSVARREILKLNFLEAEHNVFKARCEAKSLKRSIGYKGDEGLFYPHKKKKIVKVKEDDEEMAKARRIEKRKLESREASVSSAHGGSIRTNGVHRDRFSHQHLQQETASSSTQPYVKLPPSKIPDMDLVTVSLVLKEKNETIRRAVLEKLRKRCEQDKGFTNVTDDPYEPYFNISTNNNAKELSHIPYSSIAATNYHEINTSNYISKHLKEILKEGKKPLPGMKTFRGANGELIPSKPFPHLLSLLLNSNEERESDSSSYVAQLLNNIKTNNFGAYSHGYGYQQRRHHSQVTTDLSDPIFRLRRRIGRGNRAFIDRRGLIKRPNNIDDLDHYLTTGLNDEGDLLNDKADTGSEHKEVDNNTSVDYSAHNKNVYNSEVDAAKRLSSNWKFDDDLTDFEIGLQNPFSLDPSKLNCISSSTQSIRFGSMLLAKSYDLLRESVHQKQQAYIQQARMRALQIQQIANKQQQQQAQQQRQQNPEQQQQHSPTVGANSTLYSNKARATPNSTGSLTRSSSSNSKMSNSSQPRTTGSSPLLASQTPGGNQNAIPKGSHVKLHSASQLYNNNMQNNMSPSNSPASAPTTNSIDTGKSSK
ncbi:uncharacterized protein PRCAT00006350001 [Priceomyces carsonii]|uniref:uncharacterized protein n=1 Tax=Priceomyces carsonii TaxID=28549 RepID=UPI002ED7E35F|nr:unnamed protein product [Priceomyces carsonii]